MRLPHWSEDLLDLHVGICMCGAPPDGRTQNLLAPIADWECERGRAHPLIRRIARVLDSGDLEAIATEANAVATAEALLSRGGRVVADFSPTAPPDKNRTQADRWAELTRTVGTDHPACARCVGVQSLADEFMVEVNSRNNDPRLASPDDYTVAGLYKKCSTLT